MKTKEADQKYLARSGNPEDIEVVSSHESYFFDKQGTRYIDFIMGWCVGNFGWGNESILKSMQQFKGPEYVYGAFYYEPWAKLSEKLAQITPGDLEISFRTTGGTGAVETAMKIAILYTGRTQFVSIEGAYHGNSIAALSIGGSGLNETYKTLFPGCFKIDRPLNEQAIIQLESLLKNKDIAAFIMEPVLTHPGIYVPEAAFVMQAKDICSKYGTLLVMDEVATGFGRTGKMFASEHFNVVPDVMCLAKAMSGGYGAIGATITNAAIAEKVMDKIHAYPTYGWHPFSVNASIATIDFLIHNKSDLFENIERLSQVFKTRLESMRFRNAVNLSIKGLAIAADVSEHKYATEICSACLEKGLLLEYNGTNLMMFPALTIEESVVNEGLNILESCI
jgi:acetylornithine/succinyldiaminopimelate/putrescine aminotransferase